MTSPCCTSGCCESASHGLDRRSFLTAAAVLGVGGFRFGLDDIGLMSFADERKLGNELFQDALGQVTVSKNKARAAVVEDVFKRITSQKSIPKGRWNWRVVLVENDVINAFALPGGGIFVNTGIDDFTRGDNDELAIVIGHEVAHVTERHGAKSIRNARIAEGLEEKIAGAIGDLDAKKRSEILAALEAGAKLGGGLPYGRRQESAADRVGLRYAANVGFKASDALNFWSRMAASNGDGPPVFLSTHPSDSDRIQRISEELKKIK